MSNTTKAISYKDFIKLPLEQRQRQSKYLLENKPKYIPVILTTKSPQLPELKNCKYLKFQFRFLIEAQNQLLVVIAQLTNHIKQKTHLSKDDQFFFEVKSKILNPNQKSKQLYAKVKNQLEDGWLLINYKKQSTF